jgi:hypothetical protein
MVDLAALWLPIVVSAVVVFFASWVMWMVLPHHRSDWQRLPDEDGVMQNLGKAGVGAGQYSFPHCGSPDLMKDPAWVRKMEEGPSGLMVVMRPGPLNMGRSMLASVLHNLVIAVLVAYVASTTLDDTTHYLKVFRVVSTTAFLGFSGAWAVNAIWFHHTWSSTLKHMIDGLVYALLMAGIFGWLWP